MTLYAIFEPKFGKPDSAPAAVAERFSWLGFLLPPVFFLRHGLWLELAGFVLGVVGLNFAAGYIGAEAAVWLYGLGAFWIGLAASSIRRLALKRGGWRYRAELAAPSEDTARLVWLKLGRT